MAIAQSALDVGVDMLVVGEGGVVGQAAEEAECTHDGLWVMGFAKLQCAIEEAVVGSEVHIGRQRGILYLDSDCFRQFWIQRFAKHACK